MDSGWQPPLGSRGVVLFLPASAGQRDLSRPHFGSGLSWLLDPLARPSRALSGAVRRIRSEEHTSELQSLMRISYAVVCLKKKYRSQHYHLTLSTYHFIV